MKQRRISFLIVLFSFLPGISLLAQEPPPPAAPVQAHPEGDAAIGSLKSPYCPGLMLEVCPTTQAKELRDTLQVMAHGGASADSLVNWMLSNFGEEYRAVPRLRGSGLLAWIVPPLALLLGLFLVVVALRHFRARREPLATPRKNLTPEDESVLEAALQELKAAEEVPF